MVGKNLVYLDNISRDLYFANDISQKEKDWLESGQLLSWIILTIGTLTLLVMLVITYGVIKMTKCRDRRIATLLILINLTLLSYLVLTILYLMETNERLEHEFTNKFEHQGRDYASVYAFSFLFI